MKNGEVLKKKTKQNKKTFKTLERISLKDNKEEK